MTPRSEVEAQVLAALRAIAPEIDPAAIDPRLPLAEQTDLDSMDHLELLTALGARYGLDIPAGDAAALRSIDAIAGYLVGRGAA